jgi:hypothetical protein
MMRRVGAVTLAATISKMPRSKDGRTTSGLLAHEERNEAADIHGGVSEDQTVGFHKRPKAWTCAVNKRYAEVLLTRAATLRSSAKLSVAKRIS